MWGLLSPCPDAYVIAGRRGRGDGRAAANMARVFRLLRRAAFSALAFILALSLAEFGLAGQRTVTLATTTENSGLMGHLLPLFEAKTGIKVRVSCCTAPARFSAPPGMAMWTCS